MKLHILGAAQDAGIPQAGCGCDNCSAVREVRLSPSTPASVAVVTGGRFVLIDATPAIGRQLDPLFRKGLSPAALLLTHNHWGHTAGLGFFGPPGQGLNELPCYAPEETALAHSPLHPHLDWRVLSPGETTDIEGLRATPIAVPHRPDAGVTFGFTVESGRDSLFYCPDCDRWTDEAVRAARGAGIALVDGTFWSADELGHREQTEVPHPPVKESLHLFRGAKGRVLFTHLNHTNPLLRPDSAERAEVETAGMGVAEEGGALSL